MKNIIAFLIILIAIVVIVMGVVPMWSTIRVVRAEVSAHRQIIEDFRQSLTLLDSLLLSYNSIDRSLLNRMDEIVPPDPRVTSLIKTTEGIVAGTDVRLRNVDFNIPQKDEGGGRFRATDLAEEQGLFQPVTITMSIDGSYGGLRAFLGNMEKSLRLIDLNSITFNAGSGSSLSVSITASAYYGTVGN